MRPVLSAAIALPCLLLAPLAQAQQGYSWTTYFENDFATGAPLIGATFGVPETDDTAIYLECVLNDAPHVYALFSAPTGQAPTNGEVTFEWRTALGSAQQGAQVILAEEFGGIGFVLDLDSILLGQLTTASQISYGIAGEGVVTLSLNPAQSQAQAFLQDCTSVAEGADIPPPAPALALVPDLGPNISGHVWSRFTQVSDDVFETVLEVTYGVPETDDIAIRGQCFIGAQGPLVAFQVAADIDGMAENAAATLRVRNGAGQEVDVDGSVIGTAIEFGVSGIEIVLEMSDPAWLVIAGDPTLQFERVGARGGFTLTGNGPNTLGPFLADCDQIDTLTSEGGVRPSAPIGAQDGFLSCDSFGRVGSRDTGQSTVVTFFNESGAFRGLSWIDPEGAPIDQAGLNPGEQVSFSTDPGHVWMGTDGPGNCREMIQPVPGQTTYRLLAQ